MTSSWFHRQGTLYANLHDWFWKSDHDFLIAILSKFLSVMHAFRDNEVLLQAGYDVISLPGGASRYFTWRILKERAWLPDSVPYFRDNEVLLQVWRHSDFVTRGRFRLFLITDSERATLSFHVQLTLFVYLERFRRYSIFCIWLGFPYILGDELVGFFGQNNPQNVKWVKNTCWEGTSELTRLDCIFYVFVLFLYLNLECEELSDYASKMPDTSDNTLRDFFFFLQSRSTSYTNATEALSRLFAANSHSANHPDVHNPILTVVI